MNKLLVAISLFFSALISFGQSFHSAPWTIGTNAIFKDSSCFVAWANNAVVQRGFLTIADTTFTSNNSNKVDFGTPQFATGPAEGDGTSVVSLGDGGIATLSFPFVIRDDVGYDFAVFENSFSDNYMELAHVEVSSDGIHFFRFPSVSEQPTAIQLTNFTYSDCRMVNNLAGKYRAGFGTPFDLSDLSDNPLLNKQAITHVKLIDVVGSIDVNYGTTDANGSLINDAFPTPFASGGFDLDAVGIIHSTLAYSENLIDVQFFPNPVLDNLNLILDGPASIEVKDLQNKTIATFHHLNSTIINCSEWESGCYQVAITKDSQLIYRKIVKL